MFEVNLKILSELSAFLLLATSSNELLNLIRTSPTAFTRRRKLTLPRLVLFICKLCKKTLSVELDHFFEHDLRCAQTPASVAAFSQARKKLAPFFFQLWNEVLCASFYHYATTQQIKTWRGHRLIAVDGSVINLVSTPALCEHFGTHANQFGCSAHGRALYHCVCSTA